MSPRPAGHVNKRDDPLALQAGAGVMLELMESSGGGGGKGGRVPARVSGSSTPPSRSSPSHSREGSPLLLKRALHPPLAGQLSAPPVQQYHERLHASLKRSNSLKRLLKLPIFGGQTGECVGRPRCQVGGGGWMGCCMQGGWIRGRADP